MGKRVPAGELVYDPLDQGLAQSIIHPTRPAVGEGLENMDQVGEGTARSSSSVPLMPSPRTKEASTSAATRSPSHPCRGFSRTKRVLLTPEEERNIERLVDRIAEQLGATLKLSHVLRACMALLCHAETELLRRATGHHLVRPANGDAVALAEFEQGVAKLLSLALRDAPPIR